jgi:5-methylcytosine-specific restriction endonuclease McrA
MTTERNYRQEYKDFHGKPAQIEARAERNAARAKMGLGVGNPKEVDHKVPLSAGGSNSTRNLRVVSQAENRSKGAGKK